MKNITFRILGFLCFVSTLQANAVADLSLSLTPSSPSLVEGTSGYVDIFINGTTTVDKLDGFLAQLNISGGSGLEFKSVQAENHLSHAGYVFNGRSNAVVTSSPTTTVLSPTQINVGDVSDDGSNAPLSGGSNPFDAWVPGSPRLLARIDLQALLGGVGSYNISLAGTPTSSFTRPDLSELVFNTPSILLSVTAVPEPTSLVGGIVLGAGFLVLRRSRNRTDPSV